MFICEGKLADYKWKEKLQALEPHVYAQLRHTTPGAKLPESQAELEKWNDWSSPVRSGYLMDDREVDAWTSLGIEVTMTRTRGLASNAKELHQVVYQVSVANIGLMQIQRVEVLEDCCTDALQRELDRGWRILAVCPPNDARRPSYVVGHFEKEA